MRLYPDHIVLLVSEVLKIVIRVVFHVLYQIQRVAIGLRIDSSLILVVFTNVLHILADAFRVVFVLALTAFS